MIKRITAAVVALALALGLSLIATSPATAEGASNNASYYVTPSTSEVCQKFSPTGDISTWSLSSVTLPTGMVWTKVIIKAGNTGASGQGAENHGYYTSATYMYPVAYADLDWTQVSNLASTTFSHPSGKNISHAIYCYAHAPVQSQPIVVTPVFPQATPPTCDAAGSLPALPTNQPGLTFTWSDSGAMMIASLKNDGYAFKDGVATTHTYDAPASALGYQSTNSEAPCYRAPSTVIYETVVWSMPSPNNGTSATYPQVGVSQYKGETTQTLDVAVPTTCGTQYQVDVYVQTNGETDNTAALDAMFKAGLAGPNGAQDGEYLAGQSGNPGVAGLNHAWKFVQNAACPPPTYPVCTGNTTLPTSTNLAQKGWVLKAGTAVYVPGGVQLTSTNWDGGKVTLATNFLLSQAGSAAINYTQGPGSGSVAILFNTSDGNQIHYEPFVGYTHPWFADKAGVFPLGGSGQGSDWSGTSLTDLISNPTVTSVVVGVWGATSDVVTVHSATFNCQTQPFDYAIPAGQVCTTTGSPYTEDGFPTFTADGQDYEGGAGHALNWLVPTTGNLQGFTSASYTITSAVGYQAAYRFVLYANGTTGYTSVSAEPYQNGWVAGQTGVFTITPATLVWNSHITNGNPGAQDQPISITAMASLIPNNQFISQGIHYGSTEKAGNSTVVSSVSGCITYEKPAQLESKFTTTVDRSDTVCSKDGGGSYTLTTHYLKQDATWNATSASYTYSEAPHSYDRVDTVETVKAGEGECVQLIDHPIVVPIVTYAQLGCGTDGSYTLSNNLNAPKGVVWTVDGSPVAAGTYQVASAGTINIHAEANGPDYGFTFGQKQDWPLTFAKSSTCQLDTLALHDGALASTGSDPTGLLVLGGFLALFGLMLMRRARVLR
jgi:hypothetical protein